MFDIVDENDNLLGIVKSRELVHKELIDWHRTTGIYIINDQDQLLCQQRSLAKDADPGEWQSFFGGHLKASENYISNAISELSEELGLHVKASDLIDIGQGRSEEYKHCYRVYVYRCNYSEAEFKFKDGEVEQVKWMTLSQFAQLKKSLGKNNFKFDSKLISYFDGYYTENPPSSLKNHPVISSGGVVVNSDGEILVVNQFGVSWSLPKGKVEQNEDILSAAKREIYEESGLSQLELVRTLGHFSRGGLTAQGDRYYKTIHLFLFKTSQMKLSPVDPHNPQALWIKKDEVAPLLTHYKDKEFFLSVLPELP